MFGDSVETEAKGTCSNQRSSYCGKAVRENDWCGKYQKWGVLQSALVRQQQVCQPAIQRCENAERSLRQARGKQREKAEKTLKRNAMIALGICIAGLVIMFIVAFCIYSASKNSQEQAAACIRICSAEEDFYASADPPEEIAGKK